MLYLCETLDPTFTAVRVVFSIEQFQELLRSKKLQRGSFIMWDEGGAGISSRESLKQGNVWAMKVAQTMRNRNYGIAITVPSLGMIDKQIRQLAHYLMEPLTYNAATGCAFLELNRLQNNVKLDRIYCYPPAMTVDGEKVIIDRLKLQRPSDTLVAEYERKKTEFQEKLYDGDNEDLFNKLLNMHDNYLKVTVKGKRLIDWRLIKDDYQLSEHKAKLIKKKLERELNG